MLFYIHVFSRDRVIDDCVAFPAACHELSIVINVKKNLTV